MFNILTKFENKKASKDKIHEKDLNHGEKMTIKVPIAKTVLTPPELNKETALIPNI